MWRPRSDIGTLHYRDTIIRYNDDKHPQGLILHIRHPKKGQQKTTQLGVLQNTPKVCLVHCAHLFLQATDQFRAALPIDHTLLLTYLNKPQETPPQNIRPGTVSGWVKYHMQAAEIGHIYPPHSIRSASSTKAVQQGSSMKLPSRVWCTSTKLLPQRMALAPSNPSVIALPVLLVVYSSMSPPLDLKTRPPFCKSLLHSSQLWGVAFHQENKKR